MEKSGWVYIIKEENGDTLYYKVGYTNDTVENRIHQLQTGNPRELTKVGCCRVKDAAAAEAYAKKLINGRSWVFPHVGDLKGGKDWFQTDAKYEAYMEDILEDVRQRYK